MTTARQYFAAMPAAFSPRAAGSLAATYQFLLSGDGGGAWFVRVRGGAIEVGEGEAPEADVTLSAAAPDYVAIAEGRLSPTRALLTGRFKIGGSLRLAMKLEKLFPR